jgi:hypothetical protein
MARSVFYGVSAFVGSITGPTTCAFWPDDPTKLKWDPKLLFSVDLSKNPEAVRSGALPIPVAGLPSQVEVDDFAGYGTGGLTTIGPMFPGGATMGLCYVEESRCAALGPNDPTKGGPGNTYEWCTIAEYDGALAGRRFHGFHAEIHTSSGNIGIVSLWARGTSASKGPIGTWPIDFDAHVHPLADGFTKIGVGPNQTKKGALFLDRRAGGGGVIPFDTPKTPKGTGGVYVIGGRRER